MTPKVTVLLAVYDGEPYLRRAIESVLTQTFRDFELLIVDDASTDATPATIASFADDRIRVVRNERNLGQVPSLNRGLHEARGEFVARLDSDDWCLPARLERQVAILDADPRVGLVGTWVDLVDEQGRRVGGIADRLDDLVSFVYATLIMRVYISHPAAMMRRDAVLRLGGYDVETGPSEDKDLWRRLLLDGWEARIVPETLVAYRVHEGQLSRARATRQRETDRASQARFLSALAPGVPVEALLFLLAADPAFWRRDAREAHRALWPVVSGAAERLALADAERRRLETMVARRIVEFASRRPFHPGVRTLVADALSRVEPQGRRSATAVRVTAPVRETLRVAGHAEALARVRARLRSIWILRRLYGRVVGSD